MSIPNCIIPHPTKDLAIVCSCQQARCIHCFDRSLAKNIVAENPNWNKCADCGQIFAKLRVYYTNRTMTEWLNHSMARLLYRISVQLVRPMPCLYLPLKRCINWTECHFYQLYFLVMFVGALAYSDYFLLAVLVPNVHYLVHRHFYRYDYVIRARFDPIGYKEEPESVMFLRMDLGAVMAVVFFSSLLVLHRFSYTKFWMEFMSAIQTVIEM